MNRKKSITKEDVKRLLENPYVLRATEWSVSFTPEFKQLAYDEYCSGKNMREIFKDAGIDIEILGSGRIQNFRNRLLEKSNSENGFKDMRQTNYHREPQSTEAQMAKRIKQLEHRNAYLEQENEFLKIIQSLEKGYDGKVAKSK